MRINKINIPSSLTSKEGLKEINLTKKPLAGIIALAGINGSGKTRILDFVSKYYQFVSNDDLLLNSHFLGLSEKFNSQLEYYKDLKKNIENLDKEYQLNKRQNSQLSRNKTKFISNNLIEAQSRMANFQRDILPQLTKDIRSDIEKNILVINQEHLKEIKNQLPHEYSIEDILNNPQKEINFLNVLSTRAILSYIQNLCTNIIEKKFDLHADNKPDIEIENDDSFKKFKVLKKILEKLLNKSFSYKRIKNSDKRIEGSFTESNSSIERLFEYQKLSAGEKTLFAYGILMFYHEINSDSKLSENIIIIDEPELNLHPSAQIKVIDKLKEIIGNTGQLWIATHSLHILSHLHHEEIFMVSENEIIKPSVNTPSKTLVSLMETESHIKNLNDFVTSMSQWTFANFITDCFKDPDVIPWNNTSDPQVTLFSSALKSEIKIKLLDFGAGLGRVGNAIFYDENLSNKIEYYYAFEPNNKHHSALNKLSNIAKIYKTGTEIPNEQFDIVLLSNVLHEIIPQDWINVFNDIKRSLKPEGSLIILEDKFLSKGEHANKYGFLLLEEKQLEILLGYENEKMQTVSHPDAEYENRLMCCLIPKKLINVTTNNIKPALTSLKDETLKKAISIKETKNLKESRIYAQYSQQFLNAVIALKDYN